MGPEHITVMIWHMTALFAIVSGGCDPYSGPAGQYECVKLTPYYSEYQYATCLSSSYIRQKSQSSHTCRDSAASFCYYQCMLELHEISQGPVEKDCACDPNDVDSGTVATSLPAACYSPDGADCTWYENCLEKQHPCKNTGHGYAIEYAEKFCNLYSGTYGKLSIRGRQWVDSVRRCLQVALVPLIRPWSKPTCTKIKDVAFRSHPSCYTDPWPGKPGICSLSMGDYLLVFWTVKGSFIQAPAATFSQMWATMSACADRLINNKLDNVKEMLNHGLVQLKLRVSRLKQRVRREVKSINRHSRSIESPSFNEDLNTFANGVADSVAVYLKWNSSKLDWFGFYLNTSASSSENIVVLIADKGIILGQKHASNLYVKTKGVELGKAVARGTLPIVVYNERVWIQSIKGCSDADCNTTFTSAVSLNNPHRSGSCSIFEWHPHSWIYTLLFPIMIVFKY